jgi:hypothetical protein
MDIVVFPLMAVFLRRVMLRRTIGAKWMHLIRDEVARIHSEPLEISLFTMNQTFFPSGD